MNIVRRLKRLEAIGGTPRADDPLFYVRVNAMRNLAPSDWRAVSAMARRSYITGEFENTPELQAVFARWEQATAELMARNEPLTL